MYTLEIKEEEANINLFNKDWKVKLSLLIRFDCNFPICTKDSESKVPENLIGNITADTDNCKGKGCPLLLYYHIRINCEGRKWILWNLAGMGSFSNVPPNLDLRGF